MKKTLKTGITITHKNGTMDVQMPSTTNRSTKFKTLMELWK